LEVKPQSPLTTAVDADNSVKLQIDEALGLWLLRSNSISNIIKLSFIRAVLSATFLLVVSIGAKIEAQGTVRRVPADYPAIQQAINASVSGDTVLVAPGTYFGEIDIFTKAITVTSEAGPDLTVYLMVVVVQCLDFLPTTYGQKKPPCAPNLVACSDEGCGTSFDPNLKHLKNIRSDNQTASVRSLTFMKKLDDPESFSQGDTREELTALGEDLLRTNLMKITSEVLSSSMGCTVDPW
jgi:hypothetical protein